MHEMILNLESTSHHNEHLYPACPFPEQTKANERTIAATIHCDARRLCIVMYPDERMGKQSEWSAVSLCHTVDRVSHTIVGKGKN
jgi:hypothetical protein